MKTCKHPGCDKPRMEGKSTTVNRCEEHQREYWRQKKARETKAKKGRPPKKPTKKQPFAPLKVVLVDWAAGTLVKGSIAVESLYLLDLLKTAKDTSKFAVLLDLYRALGYVILERGEERLPDTLKAYQEQL